jgi:ankyrin repeat protein
VAARHNQLEIVKLLISKDCDINARNDDGDTALHASCDYDNRDVTDYLISSGCDQSIQNKYGFTANSFTTVPPVKKLCCDKCNGKHLSKDCPYYKNEREDHPDSSKQMKKLGSAKSSLPFEVIVNPKIVRQKADGSWSYGTLPFHQWIDNFHTGYNLECIADYIKYTGDDIYHKNLSNGFDYYIKNFFTLDGIAKYYNNSIYPIDIHAPSQLVITLKKLNKLDDYRALTEKVLGWTIDHMQSKNGYFYYQINKYITSKIPYMRWSQAWMFLSMNIYLLHFSNPKETD